MKLLIAIVSSDDAKSVHKGLVKENFFVTKLASTGGFLMKGNTTFLLGVEDELVDNALNIIKEHSQTRTKIVPNSIVSEYGMFTSNAIEVNVGGAVVFTMPIETFNKF